MDRNALRVDTSQGADPSDETNVGPWNSIGRVVGRGVVYHYGRIVFHRAVSIPVERAHAENMAVSRGRAPGADQRAVAARQFSDHVNALNLDGI